MHRRAWALIVGALACWAAPTGVHAAPVPDRGQGDRDRAAVAAEVRTLREQVSEASSDEAVLLERLDETQARRGHLEVQVARLDRELASAKAEVDAAEARLEEAQAEFVRAQTKLALTTDELAAARSHLRRQAVSAYVGGAAPNGAELVLRAGSLREVAATVRYLESVVRAQKRTVLRYGALRAATLELRPPVEAAKEVARAQRDVVAERRAALEGRREEHEAVRREVLTEEAGQGRLVAQVRERRADFEAQINALRAESGSVTDLLRAAQTGQPVPGAGSGLLLAPVPGAIVTSPFGPRVHPVLGTVRMHEGLDYRASMGTPIRAAAAGTVLAAGPRGGYGNATLIDHGRGLATLVAHQSLVHVGVGTSVAGGQVIGAVGSTGFSTGPHLHFEVRLSGTPVNPLLYL
ncbi:MAG: peptidoglycan DD-metalloendopeptidase family protein [Actinomycetota bacterium]|nr:peptidoglycan DD-metalloendopeptidase family protein [Actinomycetota bacterium]